jgi:hypothetical protein
LQGKNRAICYPITCNKEKKTYTVKVLDVTIECPKEGGVVINDKMDGTFYCVDYNKICTKASPCKDALECALKKVEYLPISYDYTPKVQNITYNSKSSHIEDGAENSPSNFIPDSGAKSNSNRNYFNYFIVLLLVLIFY